MPLEQSSGRAMSVRARSTVQILHIAAAGLEAQTISHMEGLNHGPLEIAVRRGHFDRGTLRTTATAEILIGVAGPMTGKKAWYGEQVERGTAMAVADLNAAGGVLGEQVELITADDFCDPEQAVAAANKLVSDGVIFVVGHYCSRASIPASEIYQAAGVLMISPTSSNPMLTELGRANVFRVLYRDDAVGIGPATTWPIIGPTEDRNPPRRHTSARGSPR